MTKTSELYMGILRGAYLNGNHFALFEALNIAMDYLPYGIDSPAEQNVNEMPVWILQALREMVVFRVENEKRNTVGAKPQDRMKYLANNAKETAQEEKKKGNSKLPLYDLAQKIMIKKFGEGLQPETIKKYAAEFNREDRKFENLGKYLMLEEESVAIYQSVKKGMD